MIESSPKASVVPHIQTFTRQLFGFSGLLLCLLFPVAKAPSNVAAVLLTLSALFFFTVQGTSRSVFYKNTTTIASLVLFCMPIIWLIHPGPGPYGAYAKDTLFALYMLAFTLWSCSYPAQLPKAINLLIVGTVFSASLSLLQYFSVLPNKDPGSCLALHNGTLTGAFSLLLAFAASILTFVVRHTPDKRVQLLGTGAFVVCVVDLLLVVPGRTGYLAFLALAGFMLYNLYKFNRYFVVLLVILASLLAVNSTNLKQRVATGYTNFQQYDNGIVNTPLGHRFEMWKISWSNFKENPLVGAGTNGFIHRWKKDGYKKLPLPFNNPHSTYFHLLGNYGLAGFLILIFFLWSIALRAWHLRGTLAGVVIGSFIVIFIVGSLSNTMLTGDFYLTWLAIISGIASGFDNVKTPPIKESA